VTIDFNQIPLVLTPGTFFEIDNSLAVAGLSGQRRKVLLVGTRLTTGTVAAEVVTAISSEKDGWTYFGAGSMLGWMVYAAKRANPSAEVYAVALAEDAAGVKAAGTFTFTGPATEDGTIVLYVGDRRIKVAVTSGDDATAIAAAADAAIDADEYVPMTSGAALGVVTCTCRWKGATGNALQLGVSYGDGEKLPAGVTCTIVQPASGATDPDIADAIAVLGEVQYHTIVMPYTDDTNMDTLEAEMESRWGALRAIEGMAFACYQDTYANTQTYGDARNSPFSHVLGTGVSLTPPWVWASSWAAIESGIADPAIPRQRNKITGVRVIKPDSANFTRAERDVLLADGVSTITVNAGEAYVERCVTTYQENAGGFADTSYRNLEIMRCLSYFRFQVRQMFGLKYPAAKLAGDDVEPGPGQQVVTPSIARAEMIGLYEELLAAAICEDIASFKETLVVERDGVDPDRLNIFCRPDFVNQARVFAARGAFKV